jgi:hypothetical protein
MVEGIDASTGRRFGGQVKQVSGSCAVCRHRESREDFVRY